MLALYKLASVRSSLNEHVCVCHDHACFVLADISQAKAVPLFKFKTDMISIYFFHYRNFHQYYSICKMRVLCMTFFALMTFIKIKVIYSEFIRHNGLLCG